MLEKYRRRIRRFIRIVLQYFEKVSEVRKLLVRIVQTNLTIEQMQLTRLQGRNRIWTYGCWWQDMGERVRLYV